MLSSLFSLFSRAAVPDLYYGTQPAYLGVGSANPSGDQKRLSLRSLIESRCPSLIKKYKPSWWLFNGHFQTAYCVAGDFSKIDEVHYERTLLSLPDGGTLGLDFTGFSNGGPDTPIVVVKHGLSGGSHESYVRNILARACAPKDRGGLGYRAVVINFRGCAGVPLTSPQFYSAGYTGDLRTALFYVSQLYPEARLIGIGFSLGANVMVRYLGEEGENSHLCAGTIIGCPWNLVKNSERLEGSWFYREVYSKAMGANLLKLFKSHVPVLETFSPSILTPFIPKIVSLKSPTLIDIDEHMVRNAGGPAPDFPFPTAMKYYAWGSSHRSPIGIRVPTLTINAADDPIVRDLPLDIDNGYVCMAVTHKGGHLGWFEDVPKAKERWSVRRWISDPIVEWIRAMGEDYIPAIPRHKLEAEEINGFTCQKGRPSIGFKEVQGDTGRTAVHVEGLLAGL